MVETHDALRSTRLSSDDHYIQPKASEANAVMRNLMGRRAATICLRDEYWNPPNSQCVTNFAAASAILMKIAARIDARKAAALASASDLAASKDSSAEPSSLTVTNKDTIQ